MTDVFPLDIIMYMFGENISEIEMIQLRKKNKFRSCN